MKTPARNALSAAERVRLQEDRANLRDVDAMIMANSIDCQWRFRTEVFWGREQIRAGMFRMQRRELEFRTLAEVWSVDGDRLAVRFVQEFRDDSQTWYRAYGSDDWELDASGLIRRRFTTINERAIAEPERLLRWPRGVRPDDHPSLTELGL